jgi:hypothetical protein
MFTSIHLLINEIINCFDEKEETFSGDGNVWIQKTVEV